MKKDKSHYRVPQFRESIAFHIRLLDTRPRPDEQYVNLQGLLEISGEMANSFEDPDDLSEEVAIRLEEHPLYPRYREWRKTAREDQADDYAAMAKSHLADAFYELCTAAVFTTDPCRRTELFEVSREVMPLLYRLCRMDGAGVRRLLLGLDRAGVAAVETADADDYRSLDWLDFLDRQAEINEAEERDGR